MSQPIQKYKPNGTKNGTAHGASLNNTFVAWDGEGVSGINPASQAQSYIMLCNSAGAVLHCETNAEMEQGLTTGQILNFVCDNTAPNTINVGFALNYDINQWLRDLTTNQMERLYRTGRVFYREFNLEWIRSKMLRIRRYDQVVTAENRPLLKPSKIVAIYDTFSFFQQSFVKTLKDWEPYVSAITPEIIERIHKDKLRRSDFTMADAPGMISYCLEEVRMLAALMEEFRNQCVATDILPRRWDGPGAIATALFQRYDVKKYKQDMLSHPTLEKVNQAAQYAFSGGRIEQVQYGRKTGGVWSYDIRSAYPSVIATLPNLNAGTWKHRLPRKHNPKSVPFGLYKVVVSGLTPEGWNATPGVMPIWARSKDGSIHYRDNVTNWVWTPEYELLLDVCPDNVVVTEAWEYYPDDPTNRPFSFVHDMYRDRAKLKKEGNPAQLILKLALNSMYGKTVQQVGRWNPDKEHSIPPYHQLEWAGFITSAVRAKMAKAAYLAGATFGSAGPIISFETDGLISAAPIPLELGPDLGDWEEETYEAITYIQPGVYFLTDHNGKVKTKTRGFDAMSITEEMVLNGWNNPTTSRTSAGEVIPPNVVGTTKVFVAFGRATERQEWRSWQTLNRRCALYPRFKRVPVKAAGLRGTASVALQPAAIVKKEHIESQKFHLKFPTEILDTEFFDGVMVRQDPNGLIPIEEGSL